RWARLRLPNGQTARCAWKEIENGATRRSRNVKFQSNRSICFGEVQYYFQVKVANQAQPRTLAMVSVYDDPDENFLRQSSDTLRVVRYRSTEVVDAKSICSVVALIPF
ncbi:hypothetical protein M378DRAFT_43371, partial [Amanita muscaria Koide BX008]